MYHIQYFQTFKKKFITFFLQSKILFLDVCFNGESPKMTFRISKTHYLRKPKQNKQKIEQRNYASITSCRTKIPRNVSRVLRIDRGISKFLFMYLFIIRHIAEPWWRSAEAWLGNNGAEASILTPFFEEILFRR
jgi:hypothetical protein